MIQTLSQAAAYLESLINVEKQPEVPYSRLGLEPIRKLLERVGDPHRDLRVIHIAGSKGKGSTALFTEAICRAAGESVGTFTSPHLERWTERFRIDGVEVAEAPLAAAVARLQPHVEALRRDDPGSAPTFFDVTTAAALLLFAEAEVDRAVLEVGLGGRLDSTNVVTPDVCCITSIELEHTDKLGTSLDAIAREKAGILKPGVPAVCGALPPPAHAAVAEHALEVGAEVAWLGRDFSVEVRDVAAESLRFRDGPLAVDARLAVLGTHQAANASLALACARRAGVAASGDLAVAAAAGLGEAVLPGRIEVLARSPWLLVDAAHTTASAQVLAGVLRGLPRRSSHAVLSISAGKDTDAILAALLPCFDRVTVTAAEPRRSLAPEVLAGAVRRVAPSLALRVVPDPSAALRAARADLDRDDLLCATGSIFLAGIARRILRESSGSGTALTPARAPSMNWHGRAPTK
jgi:dihydrofolate synthase/folylpolyglutamate synthase